MGKRTTVAFSAYTRIPQTTGAITYIKFEKVWTNIGYGYDPSTGIFTAPRQGVYHITAVVMSVYGEGLFLSINHNHNLIAGSHVTGDGFKTGTFDVILSLQTGDKVYISGAGGTVHSDINKYTTFSGHLIA